MQDASRLSAEPWTLAQGANATEADIFHCFRLLLGRAPNREEWRGHAMRVGEPLEGVVASYVNSLEFARRRLSEQRGDEGLTWATLDGFKLLVAPSDAAVGRHVLVDNYERDVTVVFRRLLRPGLGVIDIGANIGYFTMLSAALVGPEGFVLAVEPNGRNARLLEASRRANRFDHVTLSQTAAGGTTGLLVLNTSHSNGTTSRLPEDGFGLLDSETVPAVRVDALIPPQRRIDLIKVDVEGAEFHALSGCTGIIARHHPSIISEFSPNLMPGISGVTGPDYLRWLTGQGYALCVIEPDGSARPASDVETVMTAHEQSGVDHIDILAVPDHRGRQGAHPGPARTSRFRKSVGEIKRHVISLYHNDVR